ncbi:MAG TPA: glutamate--tRNA ligase [Patescibacteria group bacterium]|nr:glutamate--tRNA ligase [Patescibacteria group bacterium]
MVRVRFAPSPTGYLHIGGARTAVFNWMYARATQGKFVLRIEDTDKVRSEQRYVDEILDSLKWLRFDWDELYFQSQRFDAYRAYAEKLLADGRAYEEESFTEDGQPRGKAIIFKVQPRQVVVHDLIHGKIEFDTQVIKDQVLMKSDGTPTYNFACVVDDATMQITHVIRGDDHISNTPKQVLLYEAMGLPVPAFAHLPLIMDKEGGRLSKRTGATAISDYRKMGYLSAALVNYLLLLSWSPGDDREVIETAEAIKLFDITDVKKTAAAFDMDKLNWLNNQYLKKIDEQELAQQLVPLLAERGYIDREHFDGNYLVSLVKLFKERLTTINDFPEWADFFFIAEPAVDPKAQEKFLSADLSREFTLFIKRMEALPHFDIATIETAFRELVAELGIPAKALIHPIRVALTGKTVGPGLFEVIYYLGKERTKARLMKWVKRS